MSLERKDATHNIDLESTWTEILFGLNYMYPLYADLCELFTQNCLSELALTISHVSKGVPQIAHKHYS